VRFGEVSGKLIDRLIQGFDFRLPEAVKDILQMRMDERSVGLDQELKNRFTLPIPWQFLPLQDCVDLSIFLVRSTIELQKWIVGIRGVGGAVAIRPVEARLPMRAAPKSLVWIHRQFSARRIRSWRHIRM
jgi:hypothetical protein